MAYKIKDLSPKPEVFDESTLLTGKDRFLHFVEQHRKAVLGGISLVCVGVILIGTLVWFDYRSKEQSVVMEGQAQQLYVDRPFDQPEKAKENVGKAAELYKEILDQYPRTVSAQLSQYFLGNALIEQGDIKGGIEAYEKFVDQYDGQDLFVGLVYQRLGYAHLLNGDREKAFQSFTEVLELPGAFNQDQVLFEFAKLEETDGATEKALLHYKDLLAQFPTSPFASEASLRVKALAPEEEEPDSEGQSTQENTMSEESGVANDNPDNEKGEEK